MTDPALPLDEDPRFQRLMARGGIVALPLAAPDAWPHGDLPTGEKQLAVGDDRLSATYCTLQGHRFLRAHLLLPIKGARTVLGFEAWGSVSEDSWQAWLAARARAARFAGAFAWLANALPGLESGEPVACNLVAGSPGGLPRLQPQPGTALARRQEDGLSTAELIAVAAAAGREIDTFFDD